MKINWKGLVQQVSLKVALVALLFIIALFGFAYIVREAVYEQQDAFDLAAIRFFSAHLTPGLIHVMRNITYFGSSGFLLPAYLLLAGYFLVIRRWQRAIDIAVIGLSSTGLMIGLKQVFHRHRPQLPIIKGITTYSFPSGHALSSFIFCSVLIYLVWDTRFHPALKVVLIMLLLLCSVAIGISRVALNVHYATDVIGGFCLGIMWVILCFYLFRKLRIGRFRPVKAS